MTREEILDQFDPNDEYYLYYHENQILEAMQLYADQETSALRAENERLRGLLKQTFIYYQIEAPEEAWAKFETENNL